MARKRKRGTSNSQRWRERNNRRSERWSEHGHGLEQGIEELLQAMQEEGVIISFVHHPQNSDEDREGRDFTICGLVKEKPVERSFGVTISMHSWNEAKILHPDVSQFCWPIGHNPSNVRRRILGLLT